MSYVKYICIKISTFLFIFCSLETSIIFRKVHFVTSWLARINVIKFWCINLYVIHRLRWNHGYLETKPVILWELILIFPVAFITDTTCVPSSKSSLFKKGPILKGKNSTAFSLLSTPLLTWKGKDLIEMPSVSILLKRLFKDRIKYLPLPQIWS